MDHVGKIYLICPVRGCTLRRREKMDLYVRDLELQGFEVHYPHRDVNQDNDDGGVRICREHREAMLDCDEVHVFWTGSAGCHFDLGMAFALSAERQRRSKPPFQFVLANPEEVPPTFDKSFQNVIYSLHESGDRPHGT